MRSPMKVKGRSKAKKELKTFFVGHENTGFLKILTQTAEDAVEYYLSELKYDAAEIDGYEVFEVYGKSKTICSSNSFVLK